VPIDQETEFKQSKSTDEADYAKCIADAKASDAAGIKRTWACMHTVKFQPVHFQVKPGVRCDFTKDGLDYYDSDSPRL
jgi:hypothetical protein